MLLVLIVHVDAGGPRDLDEQPRHGHLDVQLDDVRYRVELWVFWTICKHIHPRESDE